MPIGIPIKIHEKIGKKFNHLWILDTYRENNRTKAICLCDCGFIKSIALRHVVTDKTKSCGCAAKTHGETNNPYYNIWRSFHKRCYNKQDANYKNYGYRKIYVSKDWRQKQTNELGLRSFLQWCKANSRPSLKYSLDRIDNDGPYAPWNCRWVLSSEQQKNRRKFITNFKFDKMITTKNDHIKKLKKELLLWQNSKK